MNNLLKLLCAFVLLSSACKKGSNESPQETSPKPDTPKTEITIKNIDWSMGADSIIITLDASTGNIASLKAVGSNVLTANSQGNGSIKIMNKGAALSGNPTMVIKDGNAYYTFTEAKGSNSATSRADSLKNFTYAEVTQKTVSGSVETNTTTTIFFDKKNAYIAAQDPSLTTTAQFESKLTSSTLNITGFSKNSSARATEIKTGPATPATTTNPGTDPGTDPGTNPGTTEPKMYTVTTLGGYVYYDTKKEIVKETAMSNPDGGGIQTDQGTNVKITWVGLDKAEANNDGSTIELTWPQNEDSNPDNNVDVYGLYSQMDATGKIITNYKVIIAGKTAHLYFITDGKTLTNPAINYNGSYVGQKSTTSNQKITKVSLR